MNKIVKNKRGVEIAASLSSGYKTYSEKFRLQWLITYTPVKSQFTSLLCGVTLLSILIENVVPQKKLSFTNVSITFLWAQSKKTSFRGFNDVKSLDQNYDWVQAVFYSLTHRNSSQTFLGKKIWNSNKSRQFWWFNNTKWFLSYSKSYIW